MPQTAELLRSGVIRLMANTVVQCLSLHSCLSDVMRGYVMVTLLLWEHNDFSSLHKLSSCRCANSHRTLSSRRRARTS